VARAATIATAPRTREVLSATSTMFFGLIFADELLQTIATTAVRYRLFKPGSQTVIVQAPKMEVEV